MPRRNYHSKWECDKCGRVYMSPVVGTKDVNHYCNLQPRRFKRTWRSKYDELKNEAQ